MPRRRGGVDAGDMQEMRGPGPSFERELHEAAYNVKK